jgi:microcystin-dependent protein
MSTAFLGEIRLFSFNFAPKGWQFCNGQILAINQNAALFSLLGTYYGGNGTQTFALPNLQGRVPIHQGNTFPIGQVAGEPNHTLIQSEIPAHTHFWNATGTAANAAGPTNNLLGSVQAYNGPSSNKVNMSPSLLSNAGGSQPHSNQQPYLTLNFCIAIEGIFPSRN